MKYVHNNFLSLSLSDIPSLATVKLTETFIPKCHGPHKLLASLDCPQLTEVHGYSPMLLLVK